MTGVAMVSLNCSQAKEFTPQSGQAENASKEDLEIL